MINSIVFTNFFILLPICQFFKMPSSLCCVLNCNSGKGTTKHRFPRDDALFKLWVDRTGNEKLVSFTKDHILKTCCICSLHFHKSCNSPGQSCLKKGSLPTLNLPSINYDTKLLLLSTSVVCLMIATFY